MKILTGFSCMYYFYFFFLNYTVHMLKYEKVDSRTKPLDI